MGSEGYDLGEAIRRPPREMVDGRWPLEAAMQAEYGIDMQEGSMGREPYMGPQTPVGVGVGLCQQAALCIARSIPEGAGSDAGTVRPRLLAVQAEVDRQV